MPLLLEEREEEKYPKWLRYLAIAYGIVLAWTLFSLPPAGYDLDIGILLLLIWMPVLLGIAYFFERPLFLAGHKKAMRIAIAAFAINAMFWGIVLSYAFVG